MLLGELIIRVSVLNINLFRAIEELISGLDVNVRKTLFDREEQLLRFLFTCKQKDVISISRTIKNALNRNMEIVFFQYTTTDGLHNVYASIEKENDDYVIKIDNSVIVRGETKEVL